MGSERAKMLRGELYDPLDPELTAARHHARHLCRQLNGTSEDEEEKRRALLVGLLGTGGETAVVQPPFHCDYGRNIHLGPNVFLNFNCVILDVCAVHIGGHTLVGPGVQILTPLHPWKASARRTQEFGRPISIGTDVWIGGGTLVLAGVQVGSRTVIGAGSVVTRDVPEGVLAAGNPCRVVRELSD